MKKIFTITILIGLLIPQVFAYNDYDLTVANFLAKKKIIKNWELKPEKYELNNNISRREMLKVMINLSGFKAEDKCEGLFKDLKAFDWACKYGEEALKQHFIAKNEYFRPDDNITKVEALKLIMKANYRAKSNADDWRIGYIEGAITAGILKENFSDFDTLATRAWIFNLAANEFPDYKTENEEILDLLEEILK